MKKGIMSFLKKMAIQTIMISLLVLELYIPSVKASQENKKVIPYVDVLWKNQYSTFDELVTGSDIIVIGEIKDQWTINSRDLIFTISQCSIEQMLSNTTTNEKTITISQIGGNYDDFSMAYPDEVSPLEKGVRYVLFLNGGEDGYTIAGASQGVFRINGEIRNVLDYCQACFQPYVKAQRIIDTPVTGYAYPSNMGTVYYSIDIDTGAATTTNINYLKAGVNSWNGLSGISVAFVTSSAWAHTEIHIQNSLSGYSGINVGSDTLAITLVDGTYSRIIVINSSSFNTTNNTYWQKLGCHEMGHALGLGHNSVSSSAMHPLVGSMMLYPQEADISTMRQLYGNPW